MAPILTDDVINKIDNMVSKNKSYKKIFGVTPPSLRTMKYYYDRAIEKCKDYKTNIDAVNKLCAM